MLNIATRAARRAGDVIVRSLDKLDQLAVMEKQANDYVSEVDRQAEAVIIDTLRTAYPDHAFLGEETGPQGESDYRWIIDPLDGTTNFLHGFPVFSVSIALEFRGRLEVACVWDPLRQELFSAANGDGATLNGRRLRVSPRKTLDGALLGTGFPYRDYTHADAYISIFIELMKKTAGIRRPGSAALDLCYVAAGRLDGFWEFGLKPWDMAAGALLIQEAGGFVSDFSGRQKFMQSGDIVCGGEKVHRHLLTEISRQLPTSPS